MIYSCFKNLRNTGNIVFSQISKKAYIYAYLCSLNNLRLMHFSSIRFYEFVFFSWKHSFKYPSFIIKSNKKKQNMKYKIAYM